MVGEQVQTGRDRDVCPDVGEHLQHPTGEPAEVGDKMDPSSIPPIPSSLRQRGTRPLKEDRGPLGYRLSNSLLSWVRGWTAGAGPGDEALSDVSGRKGGRAGSVHGRRPGVGP